MKRCCGCKAELPPDAFDRDRSRKDGRKNRCRPCSAAAIRDWAHRTGRRRRHFQRRFTVPGLVRCSRCATHKPSEDFERNVSTPSGLSAYCRPCAGALRAARRARWVSTVWLRACAAGILAGWIRELWLAEDRRAEIADWNWLHLCHSGIRAQASQEPDELARKVRAARMPPRRVPARASARRAA